MTFPDTFASQLYLAILPATDPHGKTASIHKKPPALTGELLQLAKTRSRNAHPVLRLARHNIIAPIH